VTVRAVPFDRGGTLSVHGQVGDRPRDDVWGAQGAGVHPVPPHDARPGASLTSLARLVELVDRWR